MPRLIRFTMSQPGLDMRRQRGAASLVVVMILLFVVAMVAAYTSRNLIFEQRTGANQYRSTRALEAAEAGAEWVLAMLNAGKLTDACTASGVTTDLSFRERYLVTDPDTGNIVPRKRSDGTDLYPTCVYDGSNWSCSCPADGAPAVAIPPGGDVYPAFRVRLRRMCSSATADDSACVTPFQPGVIRVDINGCTVLNETCLSFPGSGLANEGRATVHFDAALRSGVNATPIAALTARGAVTMGAADLGLTNADAKSSGITVLSGGAVTGAALRLQSKPGSPSDYSKVEGDPTILGLSNDRFFAGTFGVWRDTFQQQPGAVVLDCAVSCSATTLRQKIQLNPGRVFWVIGDLDFDTSGDVGSAAQPVVINVTGNVTFGTAVNVYGLVYSQAANWAINGGGGSINGAAIAEGTVSGTGTTDIIYRSDVLTRIRTTTGSFVKVPGSWKDFET